MRWAAGISTEPSAAGIGIAVRVPGRVAQLGRHPFNEGVRDGVFQEFGFVMDLVPAVAQLADEESLDQPVPPDHGQGQPDAVAGEA